MRSSSTDKRAFWPGDAGAWARLSIVVALGAGALAAPAIGTVGATGAIYTDSETAGFDLIPSPPPPTDPPTDPPTAAPTDPATVPAGAPSEAAATLPAPAVPAGPAAPVPPDPAPTTTAAPAPTAADDAAATTPSTPAPSPTQQTGQGGSPAPWPVWPHHLPQHPGR
ncbi:MAG TPA: hypothetical protein VGC04_05000 [Cellulomonas sp.]